jgi:excisionase family DNA binding protein
MTDTLVPIEELAKKMTVSVSTVRAWLRKGYIPKNTYLKIGNTYRFNVPAVIAALTASTAGKENDVEQTSTIETAPEMEQMEFDFDTDEDF